MHKFTLSIDFGLLIAPLFVGCGSGVERERDRSFGSIDANAEYLLIQGEGVPFELAVTNN